jgi:glycosyltransferase involved in cell wall biosynthesis
MQSFFCSSFNFEAVSARPEVTVGIVVRNSEETIGEAFNSVLAQDFFGKLEIIFVDDGSDDHTFEIICKLASESNVPTRIFHTPWLGIANGRNIVISNFRGPYLLWVDGDMVLADNYIQKLVEFMCSNPDVGMAKGRQSLKPLGNRLAILETYARAGSRMVDYRSKPDRSKALGTGGTIYREEMIKQIGFFDVRLKGYGEDWDYELRARDFGWSLSAIDVFFTDYERKGLSWTALWRKYWLRGYHTQIFLRKNKGLIKHTKMNPIASFLAGIFQSRKLFKKTGQKVVFLLPIEYFFKTSAWYVGFINSYFVSNS